MTYGKAWRPDRRWTDAIMRAIDEGRISARTVAYTALMYMDEAHVQRIAESEDYPLDMDDDE